MHIIDYQNSKTTARAYKCNYIFVKEIVCELFGYELKQPIERKMSLEFAWNLIPLGWKDR